MAIPEIFLNNPTNFRNFDKKFSDIHLFGSLVGRAVAPSTPFSLRHCLKLSYINICFHKKHEMKFLSCDRLVSNLDVSEGIFSAVVR